MLVLTFVRRTTFPWLTRVYFIIGYCRGEQTREESVSWGGKKRSETQPRNCVLALFSANHVSAFIALRRAIARYKRVFAEGSGCFSFSGGTKSATRTSPASPRRTERKKRKRETEFVQNRDAISRFL